MKSIRELREAADFSQLQLAIALGVSLSTIYKWERGINEPNASNLRKMAKLFNVNMEDIRIGSNSVNSAHGPNG